MFSSPHLPCFPASLFSFPFHRGKGGREKRREEGGEGKKRKRREGEEKKRKEREERGEEKRGKEREEGGEGEEGERKKRGGKDKGKGKTKDKTNIRPFTRMLSCASWSHKQPDLKPDF